MSPLRIDLPASDGSLVSYELVGTPVQPAWTRPTSRSVFAAAHVVVDPVRSSARSPVIDWEDTLAFRHHLWSRGLGVADAMDTAQRGMGFPPDQLEPLVRRVAAEARSVGGDVIFGVATDQLPAGPASPDDVASAYERQLAMVEDAGGRAVLMASRQLAAAATGPQDYLTVYERVLSQAEHPVVLHWLGEAFDPQLSGYWGGDSFLAALGTVLEIIATAAGSVEGIKVSLLSVEAEEELRARLPEGVLLYTGDDYNYPGLIRSGSHALLGAFDPLADVASAAFACLDAGDEDGFSALLEPTVPFSRHVFGAPTYDYKTGVVLMAYLNGLQPSVRMIGGAEANRSMVHLAETFRLADACGALADPDMAVDRMRILLAGAGVGVGPTLGASL